MTRVLLAAFALLALAMVTAPAPSAQVAADPLDLTTYLGPNGLTRDTNGDGIADSVAARVIVPANPTVEDSLAAANIAARLGFETSALTLPLVVRDSEVPQPAGLMAPVLVGRSNSFVRTLITRGDISLDALSPGQGLIAIVRSPLGGPAGLVVAGSDDKGTLTAGR